VPLFKIRVTSRATDGFSATLSTRSGMVGFTPARLQKRGLRYIRVPGLLAPLAPAPFLELRGATRRAKASRLCSFRPLFVCLSPRRFSPERWRPPSSWCRASSTSLSCLRAAAASTWLASAWTALTLWWTVRLCALHLSYTRA